MDPLLSQPELDALRDALREGPGHAAVRNLELCADDRLIRRALPEIDDAGAACADTLRLCFTRAMRAAASVAAQPAEIMPTEDARALEERTGGRLVLLADAGCCDVPMLIEPRLVLLHVQREFGGTLQPTEAERGHLTGLERSLLLRLSQPLTDALNRGLSTLGLRLRPRGVSTRATVTTAWPRQISVITLTWRVVVAGVSGNVHLILPPAVVEALRERFSGEKPGVTDPRWRGQLIDQLKLAEIEVVAELGRTKIALSQLLSLKSGDVLRLDRSLTEQVPAVVDGRIKLRGRPGTRGDTVTLAIEEIGES